MSPPSRPLEAAPHAPRRPGRGLRAFACSAGLAASLLPAACGPTPTSGPRPNVLLITIDTLRADHLSCYGYERETSPHLDALAAESLRFDDFSTPRAKTTPAVASLLSGRYPHDHGVRDLSAPLGNGPRLLQEVLREHGYRTGAIIGNFVLTDARSGLARGFDRWVEELPDVRGVPPHAAPQRTARSLTDAALELLDEPSFSDRAVPFFLWLHYMDPHGAYEAPEQHRVFPPGEPEWLPAESELPPAPLHAFRVADYNVTPDARAADGRVDVARVRAQYDAEIRYVDSELGRLFEHLRGGGLLEQTLVLVTADHGESLGEHRYWFEHGAYAYQATCRVPLIWRWPEALLDGPWPRRGVVTTPLSLVDLAPTVLETLGLVGALGLPGNGDPAGQSFLDLLAGREREPPVFLEKVEGAELERAVQIKACRVGPWKLVRRYAHVTREGRRELVVLSDELYRLDSDPLEARDLAADPPADAPLAALQAELLRFAAADAAFPELDRILRERRAALERDDPEALKVLEALGY